MEEITATPENLSQLSNDRLMIRIMCLAYLVQRNTEYCVFLDWSGHVEQLSISIRASKKDYQNKVLESEFYSEYAAWRKNSDPFRAELISKVVILQRILDDGEVPYELVEEEIYQVSNYSF